jgi:two-component system nitrogen regulation response regulator GlnG
LSVQIGNRPLSTIGDDLLLLVQHYLRCFSRELGQDMPYVAPEAMDRVQSHSWPGNIRELQSVLKQALLQAGGSVLLPAFFPESLNSRRGSAPTSPVQEEGEMKTFIVHSRVGDDARDLYARVHRDLDRWLLPRVLEPTQGPLQQAARLLGIARQTLRQKLRDLELVVTRTISSPTRTEPTRTSPVAHNAIRPGLRHAGNHLTHLVSSLPP